MSKKKIYLSPSNQQSNSYATGGTNEMAQCNRIASAAKTALERCGFEVKKAPEGQEMRVSINESNKFGADLHIPIHTNAGGGAGTEVFVYSTSDRNMKYAKPVYNELCKVNASKVARYIGTYRYGGSLTEITDTNAICVYCECEFHDNAVYARQIIDNATAYGEAIAKGVCSAFGVTYKSPVTKSSEKKSVLDNQGYKKGQKSDGVLDIKELLRPLKFKIRVWTKTVSLVMEQKKQLISSSKSGAMLRTVLQAITSSRSSPLKLRRYYIKHIIA